MPLGLLDKTTGLTAPEEVFVRLVITGMSQAEAYRNAYPASKKWQDKSVNSKASLLASQDIIRQRIAQLTAPVIKKLELTITRAIEECMRIAYVDPHDLFDDNGALKPISQIDPATRAAIANLEVTELFEMQGEGKDKVRVQIGYLKKIKLNDKNGALDKLMKHLGGYLADNDQKATQLTVLMKEIEDIGRGLPAARRISIINNDTGEAE